MDGVKSGFQPFTPPITIFFIELDQNACCGAGTLWPGDSSLGDRNVAEEEETSFAEGTKSDK